MTDKTITVTLKLDLDDLAAQFRAAADALTDRYAANEARQREGQMEDAWQSRDWETVRRLQDEARQQEVASMGLVECLREIERTRPGSDDQPTSEQFQEGLALAYDWLRSALRDHGVVVSSRPEPDPLDEYDHRDRLDKDGDIVRRKGHERWAWPEGSGFDHVSGWPLRGINASNGPLTFAPGASPAPQDAARGAAEGESGAVEGGGPAGPSGALRCPECGHDLEAHLVIGCFHLATVTCPCLRSPTDIARHLIAQATS